MSTPTSPEMDLDRIEATATDYADCCSRSGAYCGNGLRGQVAALVAEVRRLRVERDVAVEHMEQWKTEAVHWSNQCDALRAAVGATELDNEVLGRLLTRQNARIVAVEKLHAEWRDDPHTGVPLIYVDAIGRALAAAGVDREDTEQPQQCAAEWVGCYAAGSEYRCRLPVGHDGAHHGERVGDTGQADEPQRQDADVLQALIEQARTDQRQSEYWRTRWTPMQGDEIVAWLSSLIDFGWSRAGQVVPQQPTTSADMWACHEAGHDVGFRHEDGSLYSATCHTCGRSYRRPGPVGQDTTGGDE